jgi:23S rRNA pseudouridine1911/1915/1917 synthase
MTASKPATKASPAWSLSFRLDDEVIGQRLDKVLSGLMPEFSRSRIQQWIEDGHVTVDGAPPRAR